MAELARFANWFPPLIVGLTFTLMGGLKLYGYVRGVVRAPGEVPRCPVGGPLRCPDARPCAARIMAGSG
jgi:hypothetical protein